MEKESVMLIVDDVEINRAILTQFFKNDYVIIEATNGKEALDVIEKQPVDIVLLDLVMPVMDGFELLGILKKNEKFAAIPVIATTARNEGDSEVRAMEMGAADFITKPYNPTIVRLRVRNVMARLENEWRKIEQAAQSRKITEMRHFIERDSLTGIYNRETFYDKAASLLQKNAEVPYDIIYLDISCFKVINDLFHIETGNLILRTAAAYFQTLTEGIGLCGRMEADHFALCLPMERVNMDMVMQGVDNAVQSLSICHNILFYAGVYPVDNVFLPVDQMCDRAHMALNTVKGKYTTRFAYYDESMRELILDEQMILREMEYALEENQFCIYVQPIYSVSQHKAVSAEALVRWIHPLKGLIAPGRFIPIFERNGFIVRLDKFVWEAACQVLKAQKEKLGTVIPISVNVSRLNFYSVDFLDTVLGLLDKYDLEPWMLKLEITESAYTDNPHQLLSVMKQFQEHGLKILMDDFGSGYSSLNMLKTVPVDILKVDMNFVQDVENSDRAGSIMKNIVQMARDIDMDVVIEGVETKPQVDFLQKIGCDNIQGYYFSKPLPVDKFEALIYKEQGVE